MPPTDRTALEARWLHLTQLDLPAASRGRGWPVHADHCFQRILLDNAAGGRWYEHITGRPAYAHAPAAMLAEAVRLGEQALVGGIDLARLNLRSLAWRKAARKGQ